MTRALILLHRPLTDLAVMMAVVVTVVTLTVVTALTTVTTLATGVSRRNRHGCRRIAVVETPEPTETCAGHHSDTLGFGVARTARVRTETRLTRTCRGEVFRTVVFATRLAHDRQTRRRRLLKAARHRRAGRITRGDRVACRRGVGRNRAETDRRVGIALVAGAVAAVHRTRCIQRCAEAAVHRAVAVTVDTENTRADCPGHTDSTARSRDAGTRRLATIGESGDGESGGNQNSCKQGDVGLLHFRISL